MEEPRIAESLLAFINALPDGFARGPREQLAVSDLVLRLAAAGEAPVDLARWKTLLAPLVCCDPDQQQEFHERFDEWVASRERRVEQAVNGGTRERPRRWMGIAAALLVAIGGIGGWVYFSHFFQPLPNLQGPASPAFVDPYVPHDREDSNRITGVVKTPDGLPMKNATVWIPRSVASPEYPKTQTNSNGAFAITVTHRTVDDDSKSAQITDGARIVWRSPGVYRAVAFSPDGKLLAVGGFDLSRGHELVASAALTGTSRFDGMIQLWDVATRKRLGRPLEGHTDAAVSLAFSPDGKTLASGSVDHTVRLWDVADQLPLGQPLVGHTNVVNAVAFSPDGRTLASGSGDSTVRLWDVAARKLLINLQGHSGFVYSVVFSPDGRTLASASMDGTAILWDVAANRLMFKLVNSDSVDRVAFSPDGKALVEANRDGLVSRWDLAGQGQFLLGRMGKPAFVQAFSPDVTKLAWTSTGNAVRLWDLTTKQPWGQPLKGHTGGVTGAAFSPDQRTLVSTSTREFVAWDLTAIGAAQAWITANLLVTHPDYDPAYVENVTPGSFREIKLGRLKAGQTVKVFMPSPAPVHRRYPKWASIMAALLPLIAAIAAFLRQGKRDRDQKALLDRWETHLDLEPVRIHTRSEEDELFQGVEIGALARELRRRRPEPTSQLAVEPTVRETAARAGLFTPVRRQRRTAREYLVLLESSGGRDQQAQLWSCLLDRLAAQEVWLDRYSFSGDPRVCEPRMPEGEREWLRLEEIAARHPRHELWMMTAARRFFDPTTRQPAAWVPSLLRWPDRAVLTLAAGSEEDEDQLAELGFAVAPASVSELAGLNPESARAPARETGLLYPSALEGDELRWVQGPRPAGKTGERELRALDRQVRAWLGRDGYRCLLACAVYPGLAWNLTLHLALHLIPAPEREQTLARLVRLPWFRHSRMPHWLREFFTAKLTPEESTRVLELLRGFLERKGHTDTGRPAGLEFTRREIAADLRAQNQGPTRDYVFLSFLLGRKPRLRELEAPSWLRKLLHPEGLPALGFRRELWLALGGLAGVLVYEGSERLAYPPQPPPRKEWQEIVAPARREMAPVNSLSARAIEIAAAGLKRPADAAFPESRFDLAVPFATARGERKLGAARPGVIFIPETAGERSGVLIEQVVEGGLVGLGWVNGEIQRIFLPDRELAGGEYFEVGEGSARVNPKDGLTYVLIPAGTFLMGCSPGDSECFADEKPPHRETIKNPFRLGQTEVTQAAYQRVMGNNPSSFKGADLPVETVSWDEAKSYCEAIGGRLPSEVEWEYAARGVTTGARYGELKDIAWYVENSEGKTHPVGLKQANAYGLYDMLGNVWEWVEDLYPGTQNRSLRGGSWFNLPRNTRASYRGRYQPDYRGYGIGFRCAWDNP